MFIGNENYHVARMGPPPTRNATARALEDKTRDEYAK